MIIKHYYITKKRENSILDLIDKKLYLRKLSKDRSKVYLSTLDMKTALIHNKSDILDVIDLNSITASEYTLKSHKNNQFYCSHPLGETTRIAYFEANRSEAKAWEMFNLKKSKNIVVSQTIRHKLQELNR
ncbi:hypothetical protein [Commensalibacter oyaizuii]|uniref:Uncharacterized protein n=1 Tax=Commensalibacter oyaizuii TaxID=3043873 RepID=A0ABT6Q3U4_9PROT|nr:hypothetical protein [Commensalibacter sp. TBRC 16381]MDI2091767.1 hypothetical protein [Commensalibacter sp. TBRC 16381]